MNIIPFLIIVPLGAAFLTAVIGRKVKALGGAVANLAALALLAFSLVLALGGSGTLVYEVGGWAIPFGICMVVDGLSAFMLVTVNLVTLLVAVYSVNYMKRYTDRWQFYCLFMLMVAGMNGLIISGDLFNLFVFLEIAAIASYALVAFGTEREELEAAFKYAVMGTVASCFILLGIIFIYSSTSTLNLADISLALGDGPRGRLVGFVTILFLVGFGIKAALVPFHTWLPDAHPSAPAPISAMLSGVLIKTLGVYAMARIFFNIIGIDDTMLSILRAMAVVSMMVGVLLALGQWDFKRLLAYHSISQIGYVVLGIGLGTPLGILGGLFHLFNHSIFKSLLFLNSGAVVYETETRDLRELGGLNKRMPVTGTTSFIASMSIAGMPPFNGFWSKLLIIVACVQVGRYGCAVWAVAASILTLASFMKVQRYAFFGQLKEKWANVREVPFLMKTSMVALAAICVLGGLLLLPGLKSAFLDRATATLLQGREYAGAVMGSSDQEVTK
ncbi:MAG: monovalent cation/H+ antiporter subunit D family protein [Candidatus Tritonobacter lacicola]|nr:monovalent cation/H+ antiporter subunit D family protein [Candidatus Tritonobacter lacicola]